MQKHSAAGERLWLPQCAHTRLRSHVHVIGCGDNNWTMSRQLLLLLLLMLLLMLLLLLH